jgi:hypothetical protein
LVGLSVSTTEIVDVVSATLGTDTATRQQVLTPSHGPHALGSHAPWQLGPHLRTCCCYRTGPHLLHGPA